MQELNPEEYSDIFPAEYLSIFPNYSLVEPELPTININTVINLFELPVHKCLIKINHKCSTKFTFTELVEHYKEMKFKICPIQNCKNEFKEPSPVYHLIINHHEVPRHCPFNGCVKSKLAFKNLDHSLEENHPNLVKDGIFKCPDYSNEICCATDLISLFNHYKACCHEDMTQRRSHMKNYEVQYSSHTSDLLEDSNDKPQNKHNLSPENPHPSRNSLSSYPSLQSTSHLPQKEDTPLINYNKEEPIYLCRIHPEGCLETFTYTKLKEHYLRTMREDQLTQCPLILESKKQCKYQGTEKRRDLYLAYHLIKHHHGTLMPRSCSLPNCNGKNTGNLRCLKHSLNDTHKDLILNREFICPACNQPICCATDLIQVYKHYGDRNIVHCANGAKKPKEKPQLEEKIALTKEQVDNFHVIFKEKEEKVHQCLIHEKCPLMTFSTLKKHYKNEKLTSCPLEECSKKNFNFSKRTILASYHLISHHGVPNYCSLDECRSQQLRSLTHFMIKSHSNYIENDAFFCPACKEEVCSPTDLISIFKHYQDRSFNTCIKGKLKPTANKNSSFIQPQEEEEEEEEES